MVRAMAQTSQPAFLVVVAGLLRLLRRRARLGGQPRSRRRPGGHRVAARERPAPTRPRPGCSPWPCSAWRTGSWSRTWGSSAAWARTRTRCCPWPCSSSPATWPWSGSRSDTAVAGHQPMPVHRGRQHWWERAIACRTSTRTVAADRARWPSSWSAPARWRWRPSTRTPIPILTEALDGTPNSLDVPAPPFALTDQHGHPVSLGQPPGARGRTHLPRPRLHVGLPADRPGVPTDGPAARRLRRGRVDFVAIVANPIYRSASFTNAFDRQESLDHLANWYFLTGSVAAACSASGTRTGSWCSTVGARRDGRPQRPGLRHRLPGSRARRPHRRPRSDPDVRLVVLLAAPEPDRPSPQFVRSRAPGGGVRRRACWRCPSWPASSVRVGLLVDPRVRRRERRSASPLASAVSTTSAARGSILPMGICPTESTPSGNCSTPRRFVPLVARHATGSGGQRRARGRRFRRFRPRGGVLPSGLLRFSPLSLSGDGGRSWSPVFLPGAVAALPTPSPIGRRAPAEPPRRRSAAGPVGAAEPRRPGRRSSRPARSAARSPAAAGPRRSTRWRSCRAARPWWPRRAAAAATSASSRATAGAWQPSGFTLRGPLRGSATAVLRLEVTGPTMTALVAASRAAAHLPGRVVAHRRRTVDGVGPAAPGPDGPSLATRGRAPTARWPCSSARTAGRAAAFDVDPGGAWSRLPPPPPDTTALSPHLAAPTSSGGPGVDAFTVHGGSLGVFALTPARGQMGPRAVESGALAYGSSS